MGGACPLVRRRLRVAKRQVRQLSIEARAIATQLREMREAICAALGDVEACSTCTIYKQRVSGRHGLQPAPPQRIGGTCCSAKTDQLFDETELEILAAAGTRPRHIRAPRKPVTEQGCAFCGDVGCSLQPADRPCVCIGYICAALGRELAARGDAPRIAQMIEQMENLRCAYNDLPR